MCVRINNRNQTKPPQQTKPNQLRTNNKNKTLTKINKNKYVYISMEPQACLIKYKTNKTIQYNVPHR